MENKTKSGAASAYAAIIIVLVVLATLFILGGVFGMPAQIPTSRPIMGPVNCVNVAGSGSVIRTAMTATMTSSFNGSSTTLTVTAAASCSK